VHHPLETHYDSKVDELQLSYQGGTSTSTKDNKLLLVSMSNLFFLHLNKLSWVLKAQFYLDNETPSINAIVFYTCIPCQMCIRLQISCQTNYNWQYLLYEYSIVASTLHPPQGMKCGIVAKILSKSQQPWNATHHFCFRIVFYYELLVAQPQLWSIGLPTKVSPP
jgi:hypothetical protein